MSNNNNTIITGAPLAAGNRALIMVHGRGAAAQDILSIANYLDVEGYSLVAPEAPGRTWYPLSFLAAPHDNEPHLSQAIAILEETVRNVEAQGVSSEDIYFVGFSQGACLVSEFTTRNAKRYGGIAIFTGGLIGDRISKDNYNGNFNGTPVFIGTSNPDFHVPVERVHDTVAQMELMGAKVTLKVYDGMPHTISQDEIDQANKLIFKAG